MGVDGVQSLESFHKVNFRSYNKFYTYTYSITHCFLYSRRTLNYHGLLDVNFIHISEVKQSNSRIPLNI